MCGVPGAGGTASGRMRPAPGVVGEEPKTVTIELPTAENPVVVIEGDCLDVLPMLPAGCVDACISDPPYGMNLDTDNSRFSGGTAGNIAKRGNGMGTGKGLPIIGDDKPFDPSPWIEFPRVVLWGFNHFASRLPVGTTLAWIKRFDEAFGSFLSDAELAWSKGGCGVYCRRDLSLTSETRNRFHPTQKPVGIMRWCIERAKVPEGGTILDPFAGSGTTGVAAILEGRRAILIEKDPAYCEIIRRRIAETLCRPVVLKDGRTVGQNLFAGAA